MHKISVQTGDWYDELFGGDENPDKAFVFIKNCGFDAVDYNLDHTLSKEQIARRERAAFFDRTPEQLLEYYRPVKTAAEKAGIAFAQAHAPFPLYVEGDPAYNDYLVFVVERLLEVCRYLGCPALVVHPIKEADKAREWELNMAMYRKLIPAAKRTGVKICLENLWEQTGTHVVGRACADAAEACRYLDTLNELAGEDCFGFCFDVGHANLTARNIREDLKTLGRRLTVLHIHDNDGQLDRHRTPYSFSNGDKTLPSTDWEGFLAGLREAGYQGELNFETFGALKTMPQALYEPTLRYISAIGQYFQTRLS